MWCCQKEGAVRFCPGSLGLAFGFTSAIMMLAWGAYGMWFGFPAMHIAWHAMVLTWPVLLWMCVGVFVKGFVFGFIASLFYNYFSCCCKALCKKQPPV